MGCVLGTYEVNMGPLFTFFHETRTRWCLKEFLKSKLKPSRRICFSNMLDGTAERFDSNVVVAKTVKG